MVSGWKKKRYDPISKTLPTKLFNATARKVSGIKNLHDFNCGLKAYRKDVVKNIEVYGEMHRYIPYLAKNAGFNRIGEKVVHHQARKFGNTKFGGWNRFFNGYLDLISLWFLSKFGVKPMHFFGLLGSLTFILGFISVVAVGISKLYSMQSIDNEKPQSERTYDFEFIINDRLTYHQQSDFHSPQAKSLFNKYRQAAKELEQQQTELNKLRETYATAGEGKKAELTPLILKLEKQIDQLVEETKKLTIEARNAEVQTLK